MGDLGFEICGKIDDSDGAEGAFLGTDSASDTQRLGDEGKLGVGRHFDTELAAPHNRTRLFAFLATFLDGIGFSNRLRQERWRNVSTLGLHCRAREKHIRVLYNGFALGPGERNQARRHEPCRH